jgi:glycosyltransferase involved in cell wall biosynthesis
VDSWLQSSAQGSGTAVGIGGLQLALRQMGHHVERLAPTTNWPGDLQMRRLWFNVQLPGLLRGADYDLVVGFDIDGFCYSPRKSRLPFVASIKGVLAEEARQETGKWRLLLKALSYLERHNARHADLVVSTSGYCLNAIRRHYGVAEETIRLVPEGIDLARWDGIARQYSRDSDGRTIVCVARQYRRKRIQDLLRALVLVRREFPAVRAVIVGDGPEHARWRRLKTELGLEDIVDMRGEVGSDDEVARLYRKADIFCLPSIQEGFGIVFLEAMANGLPVVSTNAAAIGEVVPHGQAGLLVTPRDVSALAESLLALLRDQELRERLGEFGRRHVRQYDWPVVARMFLEQVQGVVGT